MSKPRGDVIVVIGPGSIGQAIARRVGVGKRLLAVGTCCTRFVMCRMTQPSAGPAMTQHRPRHPTEVDAETGNVSAFRIGTS
jgi:hypothetical protein